MSIYTRTGDQGETWLLGKERFSKADLIFSIIGTIDEANSHLGLAASLINPKLSHKNVLKNKIEQVQKTLFRLGSMFAGVRMSLPKNVVNKYEKEIDTWQKIMPVRKNFILPGGCPTSAELFIARSVVRRLERELVAFSKKQDIKPRILIYVNRLADYLYVLARYINFREGEKEEIWKSMGK